MAYCSQVILKRYGWTLQTIEAVELARYWTG
jgi:hypothetical protein